MLKKTERPKVTLDKIELVKGSDTTWALFTSTGDKRYQFRDNKNFFQQQASVDNELNELPEQVKESLYNEKLCEFVDVKSKMVLCYTKSTSTDKPEMLIALNDPISCNLAQELRNIVENAPKSKTRQRNCWLIKMSEEDDFNNFKRSENSQHINNQYIIIKGKQVYYWDSTLDNSFEIKFLQEKSWNDFEQELNLQENRLASDKDRQLITAYTGHTYPVFKTLPLPGDMKSIETVNMNTKTFMITGRDQNDNLTLWALGTIPGRFSGEKADNSNFFPEPVFSSTFTRMHLPIITKFSGYRLGDQLRDACNELARRIEEDNAAFPYRRRRNQKIIEEVQKMFMEYENDELTVKGVEKFKKKIDAMYPSMPIRIITGLIIGLLIAAAITGLFVALGPAGVGIVALIINTVLPSVILGVISVGMGGFGGAYIASQGLHEQRELNQASDDLMTQTMRRL